MVAHDVALWNGNDTSLSSPTTTQYMARFRRSLPWQHGDHRHHASIVMESSRLWRRWSRTTATMCVLRHLREPGMLDLIDREMKTEFNVVLNTDNITGESG